MTRFLSDFRSPHPFHQRLFGAMLESIGMSRGQIRRMLLGESLLLALFTVGITMTAGNWVSVEVLFYGAITLLASLSISGKEFSDALRLYRILLVFLTGRLTGMQRKRISRK